MTSRGQCPRGVCACEYLHPPFQEILYPRLDRDPPQKLYPISPTGCVQTVWYDMHGDDSCLKLPHCLKYPHFTVHLYIQMFESGLPFPLSL